MKKLALLLTLVLIVGMLCACGSANNSNNSNSNTENATPTNTPIPETPTPSPTPTPTPIYYFKCDFDSAPEGLLLNDLDAESAECIKNDPTTVYLAFGQVGSGMADFGEGKGKDGSNCLVATGRNSNWNGISITVDPKWYGKGFKVSFDGKCVSQKDGVTDMLVSLTTQFQYIKEDGTASGTVYPAYNRATGTSSNGEWVHCENTVFIPTNINGNTAQLYFECADGRGKEDILIDNLVIELVDGIGDYNAFEAYWAEHAPVEEE